MSLVVPPVASLVVTSVVTSVVTPERGSVIDRCFWSRARCAHVGDDGDMTTEPTWSDADVEHALANVRQACLDLPEVTEKLSHGAPTFFVKKSFVMFHDDHHSDGRLAIWCAAPSGVQELMVESEPDRFFVPPYVGHRGWLGVRLDVEVDWDEVTAVVEEAYRSVAPARALRQLEAERG